MTTRERDQVVTVGGGRSLAYCTWGDSDGVPVFSFHGGGESRLDRPHDEAALAGVRLITIDRPGHGLSDFQPDRTLLDWPADVAAVADALAIERFIVYGHSGGGPYAIVCAYAMPDRIRRAAVVSSSLAPPVPLQVTFEQMQAAFTAMWPGIVDAIRSGPERGIEAWSSAVGGVDDCDRSVMERPGVFEVGAEAIIEGAREGVDGVAYDLALLLTRPWGFDPSEIRVPVESGTVRWIASFRSRKPNAQPQRSRGRISPSSTMRDICSPSITCRRSLAG